LMASIPADFRYLAPSTSLRNSMPLGGTTSTRVTKSPAASLRPSSERCARGGGVMGDSPRLLLLTCVPVGLPLASAMRRADFMDRVCSGVVPQQPPTRLTPALTNLRA